MAQITGTAGGDTLTGTTADDVINGMGGADVLIGGGGNDILSGGDGDDRFVFDRIVQGPVATVDGGAGTDTLDFSAYDISSYFFSQPLIVGAGANGSLAATAFFYQRGGGGTEQVVIQATGIEKIILGAGVGVSAAGHLGALTVQATAQTGQGIETGAGDDVIILNPVGQTYGGSTVDGNGGADTLVLSGGASDYLFVRSGDAWRVYDGPGSVHIVREVESVRFGAGSAISFDAAAAADFNAEGYLAKYGDLSAAFGTDVVRAFQHYQTYGEAEGRTVTPNPVPGGGAPPGFDALSYIASYPDLIRALGNNAEAGARHYQQFGMSEGRAITFDPAAYAAAHPDLARIVGVDTAQSASHYIVWGWGEGRATTGFDAVAYLLSNPDLGPAFAAQGIPQSQLPAAARTHWLTFGADEGRSGDSLFGRDQAGPRLDGLGMDGRSVTSAVFETAGDRDWFLADLPTRTPITLNGSDSVSGLSVYDARGRLLVHDADGRDVVFYVPVETSTAAAGSVYIVASSNGGGGAYSITASRTGAGALDEIDKASLSQASNALPVQPASGEGADVAASAIALTDVSAMLRDLSLSAF